MYMINVRKEVSTEAWKAASKARRIFHAAHHLSAVTRASEPHTSE